MKKALAAGLAALIAACAPDEPRQGAHSQQQANAAAAAAEAPARESVDHENLFGQWQVVEVPGVPAGEPLDIHMLIGRYGIEAISQCVSFGKMLPGIAPAKPPTLQPQRPPAPVCARALTPTESIFGSALASVDSMERLEGGKVALASEAGDIVIARSQQPVLNPFQNVPGPGPHLMWGEWRIAAIDGSPPDTPMSLLFFKNRLEFGSGCVHFGRFFEQEGSELRLSPDPAVTTICERMTSPAEEAVDDILSGTVRIAESSPRRRLLRGAEGAILLVR